MSHKKPLTSHPIQLHLPFNNNQKTNKLKLINTTFNKKSHKLITLTKKHKLNNYNIQTH